MKKALITGITGQDGSYLAEFLLNKGYEVHGIQRRSSTLNTGHIGHLYNNETDKSVEQLFLHFGDLSDMGTMTNLICQVQPDEIYHLGAQSHVRVSFDIPEYTGNVTGLGTTRLLEAIRCSGIKARFYQASSSEMFGESLPPQAENTMFYPRSPYAAAKVYAYWMVVNYRESYNMFACNGILFNHESPRRGETFVSRKIVRAIVAMLKGEQKTLYLGNLDARRDWGFAPEYVEMMWLMLQQDNARDYVVGTGQSHTVREFVEKAFLYAGLSIEWQGNDLKEKGIVTQAADCWQHLVKKGQVIIEIDERYFRPTEVNYLQANIAKARKYLNWSPRVTFDELIYIMLDHEMKAADLQPLGSGLAVYKKKKFDYCSL